MPIQDPVVPDDVKRAFLTGLENFLSANPALRDAIKKDPEGIQGLPVYTIALDSLVQGARTEVALYAGWRVFYRRAAEALAGDVQVSLTGQAPRLVSISRGTQLGEVLDSVELVLNRTDLHPETKYQLRLLRIAGVFMECCWLVSGSDQPDVFVPVISGLRMMQARETYLTDAFFLRLSKVAGVALQFGSH
ncbi:MAG: hypothetical protein ABI972_06555 [Acidobacteriota bacterium]